MTELTVTNTPNPGTYPTLKLVETAPPKPAEKTVKLPVYKRGRFRPFRATQAFTLGAFDLRLEEGDLLLYDGYRVLFKHHTYDCENTQGAVRLGWLVRHSRLRWAWSKLVALIA